MQSTETYQGRTCWKTWTLIAVLLSSTATPGYRLQTAEARNQSHSEVKKSMTPLMLAAKKGDFQRVNALLRSGTRVDEVNDEGFTALQYAVFCGNIQIVNALLAAGANVNAKSKHNVTPLMMSINMMCPSPVIPMTLLKAGADVNVADVDGNTALTIATTEATNEVMREILKKGASPNVQDKQGNTPLHIAALNGLAETVELLLEYGAKPTIKNLNGQTAIDVANKRSLRTLELLTKSLPAVRNR